MSEKNRVVLMLEFLQYVSDLSSFPQLLCESGLPPKDIVEIVEIMLPYCGNVVLCGCWYLMLNGEEIEELRNQFPAIGHPRSLKALCRLAIRQHMPTQAFGHLADRFKQILPEQMCNFLAYH